MNRIEIKVHHDHDPNDSYFSTDLQHSAVIILPPGTTQARAQAAFMAAVSAAETMSVNPFTGDKNAN